LKVALCGRIRAYCISGGAGHIIDANDYVRPIRRAFITETGPVIAVIWGKMENHDTPISPQVLGKIASFQQFQATNDFVGEHTEFSQIQTVG
jgi:hypothetical protein